MEEIVIINRAGAAIASSAETFRGLGTMHRDDRRIFPLSEHGPVAIVTSGYPEFMGIPLETVIGEYMRRLGTKRFSTLAEYSPSFIGFLQKSLAVSQEQQKEHVTMIVSHLLESVSDEVVMNRDEPRADIIQRYQSEWEAAVYASSFTEEDKVAFLRDHGAFLDGVIREAFEEPLTVQEIAQLKEVAASSLFKFSADMRGHIASDIVFVGFGSVEMLPRIQGIHVEGMVNKTVKYLRHDIRGRTSSPGETGQIFIYGQGDAISTFIEGVNKHYKEIVREGSNRVVQDVLDEVENIDLQSKTGAATQLRLCADFALERYLGSLDQFVSKKHIKPLTSNLAEMGRGDMAKFAAFLAELPSWKSKVSPGITSTGGPVDVAVISKTEGFRWVRRSDK